MRHVGYFLLALSLLGVYVGTRKATTRSASSDGIVTASDYVPIPPGH